MEGFIRPHVTVLPDGAVVPEKNVLRPAPTQFTHELTANQPYYFDEFRPGARPDGEFISGTKVRMLDHCGGGWCRVVDARGLCASTQSDGLREL